jgi:hypothetical protein
LIFEIQWLATRGWQLADFLAKEILLLDYDSSQLPVARSQFSVANIQ